MDDVMVWKIREHPLSKGLVGRVQVAKVAASGQTEAATPNQALEQTA